MLLASTENTSNNTLRVVTEVTEAPENDVIGRLGLSPVLFVGQLINFVIVLVVLWLFAYKPLLKLMKERTARIEQGLKHADEVEARVKALEGEREEVLAAARVEAKGVVEGAMKTAEEKRTALLVHAKEEVEKVVTSGKEQLKRQTVQAMQEMKEDVAKLVVEAVKVVAGEAVDQKKARAAAMEAIEKARNAV